MTPHATAPDTVVLLNHPFKPRKGSGVFTRLRLYADRVEVRRLGLTLRTIPLADVEDVYVSSVSDDPVNLRLQLRGGASLAGHVSAVALWKFKLRELLGLTEVTAPVRSGYYGYGHRLTKAA